MKLLFIIRSLETGGAERQLVYLATGLKRRNHEVSVVTLYSGGAFTPKLEAANIPVLSLNKRSRWDLSFVWRLRKIIQAERPDVIHGYLSAGNILCVLLKP